MRFSLSSGDSPTLRAMSVLIEGQVTWPASAEINTPVELDLPTDKIPPDTFQRKMIVVVNNPSSHTDLTASLVLVEPASTTFNDGGDDTEIDVADLGSFDEGVTFQPCTAVGLMSGAQPTKIVFKNATALSSGQGFTADVRVRIF